jgi:hypothetical protein
MASCDVASTIHQPLVGGEGRETTLAALLGDDELLSRAAAMEVFLPPRASAMQAEMVRRCRLNR